MNAKNDKTKVAGDFEYVAGLDIGNGYVKGLIEPRGGGDSVAGTDVIDMPSSVVQLKVPSQIPTPDDQAAEVLGDDIYNNIDMTTSSPMVGDQMRRLFGRRSLNSAGSLDEFDLVGKHSKAQQKLSKVLVLGIIAAKAVKDYVAINGHLPQPGTSDPQMLTVSATVSLALPINEFMSHRDAYAAAFKGASGQRARLSHLVTIGNFETPVVVRIIFSEVVVIAEGASAQYAITNGGEPLMKGLLADVRARGMALEGIGPADVLAATNTIGVDVGEGTVNFPVFTGGKFNADSSRTLAKGYGSVLEDAIDTMDRSGFAHSFRSRKQLADYLQTKPSALKQNFYAKVSDFVAQQAHFFVAEIAQEFSAVLADVGAVTEVAYVYGGGSGPLRESLHVALMDKAVEMGSEDAFPVMYLDSKYSRNFNREGLMLAARRVAATPPKK